MSKKNGSNLGARDSSPFVYQPDKIKEKLEIRDLEWTDKQKLLFEKSLDKNTKINLKEYIKNI